MIAQPSATSQETGHVPRLDSFARMSGELPPGSQPSRSNQLKIAFTVSSLAVLALFWYHTFAHLRVEWSLNPQYTYGWSVPLLCAFLAFRRRLETRDTKKWTRDQRLETGDLQQASAARPQVSRPSSLVPSLFLCLLFIGTRFIAEANPDWRLVSWALAIEAIAFTFLTVHVFAGPAAARQYLFPLAFFLVAIPWPTPVEHGVIQSFTRINTAAVIEILHLLGFPAVQHGNVIEVSTGLVGIDEACSGIRSTQAVLMLALFFGEFFGRRQETRDQRPEAKNQRPAAPRSQVSRLSSLVSRLSSRLRLVAIGLLIAAALNIVRTSILAILAARGGLALSEKWHDTTGIAVLLTCFTLVWLLAKNRRETRDQRLETFEGRSETRNKGLETPRSHVSSPSSLVSSLPFPVSSPRPCGSPVSSLWSLVSSLSSLVLLASGELAIHLWYSVPPATPPVRWIAAAPTGNPTVQPTEVPARARTMLRYSDGASARWYGPDDTAWQMFYFHWNPGRTATYLAHTHTPDICLPANGKQLQKEFALTVANADGVALPFRTYQFGGARGEGSGHDSRLFVFYLVWEDGATEQTAATKKLDRNSRLAAVLNRQRNPGQRVLELAISGPRDLPHAQALLRAELPRLVRTLKETRD